MGWGPRQPSAEYGQNRDNNGDLDLHDIFEALPPPSAPKLFPSSKIIQRPGYKSSIHHRYPSDTIKKKLRKERLKLYLRTDPKVRMEDVKLRFAFHKFGKAGLQKMVDWVEIHCLRSLLGAFNLQLNTVEDLKDRIKVMHAMDSMDKWRVDHINALHNIVSRARHAIRHLTRYNEEDFKYLHIALVLDVDGDTNYLRNIFQLGALWEDGMFDWLIDGLEVPDFVKMMTRRVAKLEADLEKGGLEEVLRPYICTNFEL